LDLAELLGPYAELGQPVLRSFSQMSGVSCSVLDLNGTPLIASGGPSLCMEFHRVHPGTRARCTESDTVLANRIRTGSGFHVYQCGNGLTDAVAPILVEGQHVANAFAGQFFLTPPDLEFFRRQAQQYGFPLEPYLDAVRQVPVIAEDRLEGVMAFLTAFAELVGAVAVDRRRATASAEALRQSEERHRALFVAAADAVILTCEGRVVDCNPQTAVLFGHTREETLGLGILGISPELQPSGAPSIEVLAGYREAALAGTPQKGLWRFKRRDGATFDAEVTLARVDIDGRACLQGVIRDVTERLEANQRVEALSRGLREVVDATAELLAAPDLDTLLRRAVELARERFDLERCSIYLYANGVFTGTYGTDDDGRTTDEHTVEFSYHTLEDVVLTARERGTQWVVDDADRTRWDGHAMLRVGTGWVASTPIVGIGGPVGVLFNDAAITGAPLDPVRQEAVAAYCATLGVLIERLRSDSELRRQEEARVRQLEEIGSHRQALLDMAVDPAVASGELTRAAPLITERVARCLRVDRVAIWLAEDGMRRIRCSDLYSLAAGAHEAGDVSELARHPSYLTALRSGRALEAVDARSDPRTSSFAADYLVPEGVTSVLDIPIRQSGIVVGVLCCEHMGDELRAWRDHEVSFASEAGDLVAQVLLNARRSEAEAALRQSEEQFRLLVDGAPDGVFVSTDGQFAYVNQAALAIVGADSAEQLLGTSVYDRIAEEFREVVAERARGMQEQRARAATIDEVYLRMDGTRVDVEVAAVPIVHQGRDSLLVFVRDATERKVAEAARAHYEARSQRAQRLESLGVLAGGIAHDFNNILAAIVGFGELAQQETVPGTRPHEYLGQILAASIRARDLVRQVLAFSRKAQTDQQLVRTQDLLSEASDFLRASLPATIEIRQRIDPRTPPILVDPSQIQQVIINLCTNAQYAMRERGGVLTLSLESVRVEEGAAIGLGDVSPGLYACIGVHDTGCGMDAATVEHVFEPFFTTKPAGEGTGLGLATSHGIVAGHGGAITVHSHPGEGTSFSVYLPCAAEPEPAGPAPEAAPARGGTESILLVDDEPALVATGQIMLTGLGYRVTALGSSTDALALLTQGCEAFDLLVTDHTMPHLTGLDLAAAAHASRPGLPVIVTTGYGHHVDPARANAVGVGRVLLKPYTLQQLAEAVRTQLDSAGPRVPVDADTPPPRRPAG
jgi:PAS domain S-box-containing protein